MKTSLNKNHLRLPLLAAVMMGVLSACSGPKLVAGSTGTKDQVKFLYVQDKKQGILKCKVDGEGKPSGCREIALILQD